MAQDLTFGQAVPLFTFFGIEFEIPIIFLNWTLTLEPDGSWRRRSQFLGIDVPSAN